MLKLIDSQIFIILPGRGDWGIPPIFERSPLILRVEGNIFIYIDKEEKTLKFK